MSDLHLCNCMYEHALVPQGRWVPWCVEHDEKGSKGSHYCERPIPNPCRWHPQGAFIPDDEGGTKCMMSTSPTLQPTTTFRVVTLTASGPRLAWGPRNRYRAGGCRGASNMDQRRTGSTLGSLFAPKVGTPTTAGGIRRVRSSPRKEAQREA